MLFSSKPKYEYLIVGLGNPGDKYKETRHNVGFRCADKLIQSVNSSSEKTKFDAILTEAEISGHRVLICKPITFMNNSGESVSAIIKFYKIPAENLIIISDDVSMDAGRIRIRKSGSHGGHNGLKSIFQLCGTDNIPRIKIGVGQKPHPDYDLADWVLGKPNCSDKTKIDLAENDGAEAVKAIVTVGADRAMNKFNR